MLILFIAIVGTTIFPQTFAFTEFNESKSQFYRHDELENLAKIEKIGNSLVRVLNAIVLLQDVNENPTVMKKVLAEALNVQNVSLIFWKAVVWIAVMLLACACGPVIYWFRTVIDEVREKSRN
uniref:WSN domain-containing protein n=1 Tax=Caenorhabditis japonica TaxID=281687 RepID=A0A8R1EP34_CAEJA